MMPWEERANWFGRYFLFIAAMVALWYALDPVMNWLAAVIARRREGALRH